MSVVTMGAATGPLTAEERAELERLAAMPDETIDLSDMPEVTDWSCAIRGRFYRPKSVDGVPQAVTAD